MHYTHLMPLLLLQWPPRSRRSPARWGPLRLRLYSGLRSRTLRQRQPVGCSHTAAAASLLQDSIPQKAADTVLSVAIPVHLHITTNAVVTDYVPKNIRCE